MQLKTFKFHGKTVFALSGYTKSKHEIVKTLATTIFIEEIVKVTSGMVKELKSLSDHLVTLAKDGSLHARRQAASLLRSGEAVSKLFSEIGPRFAKRNGGYTRGIKAGVRLGDNAQVVIVEFVD